MWFELTYQFLGGLGIFFFGMKTLSESLQSLAGNLIRNIIRTLTTNRLMAVMVGTFVTTIIQSSSVTTVMVVGLVNAGLMELTQAIGVIFGANIGTTITGWIIAIKVGKYGLLFVGLGIFPLLFARSSRLNNTGRLLLALGFVFLGLEFMSGAFKPLRDDATFLTLMQYFTADQVLSVVACVVVGALLTFVIQSSSAMLGITIALAGSGAITFQTAVALVLGENIGTTITALLASIGANTEAKRAARAHAVFNFLGVIFLIPFFWSFLSLVEMIIGGNPDAFAPDGTRPRIAAHIAGAHTLFNVTLTIVFLPFLTTLAKFIIKITPGSKKKEKKHLKHLDPGIDTSSPALAIPAAEKEIDHLAALVNRALKRTKEYVLSEQLNEKVKERVFKYESISDSIQTEITVFVCQIQTNRLSKEESTLTYALIRAADELESIVDYCAALVRHRDRLEALNGETKERFTKEMTRDLETYFDKVIDYFEKVKIAVANPSDFELSDIKQIENRLVEDANLLREEHRIRVLKSKTRPIPAMLFSDMIVSIRKIRSHTTNLAEAILERKHSEE